jgi:hypothetical protein
MKAKEYCLTLENYVLLGECISQGAGGICWAGDQAAAQDCQEVVKPGERNGGFSQ